MTFWISIIWNPAGFPILPYLLCQIPSRIVHYSGTVSSLYLRQTWKSLNLGLNLTRATEFKEQLRFWKKNFERNIRMRLFLHWINLLIIVFVAISLFTEPAWADKATSSGKEIALVNGKPISKIQYERRLSAVKKRAARKGRQLKDADLTAANNQILEDLIDAEVLYQQSQKEGIKVDEQTIDKKIEGFKKRFSGESGNKVANEKAYKMALKRMHISEKELRSKIERALAMNQLLDTNVRKKITVTEEELKKYYNNNQNLFKQKEQVKFSRIFIKVPPNAEESIKIQARKKIETIQNKAQQGEDFGKLAKTYSEGPAAKHEGNVGYIDKGHMKKPFEDAAFSLNVGEVSEIIETQHGYYLIKVTDKKPAGIIPYKEVLPMIERQLKKEKKKTETKAYIENLKKAAKIERFN